MTDRFTGFEPKGQRAAARVCRVSYTLNNSQPVLCTLIGDQPLFYMDCVEALEDVGDSIFDLADIAMLEREIAALRDRVGTEMPERDGLPGIASSAPLFQSGTQDFSSTASCEITLTALETALEKSRLAKSYLECARAHGVTFLHAGQGEDAFYNRKTGIILLNPHLPAGDQILLAARELRRHWQHRQGALIHPLLFHPDSAILVNRAQAADLSVAMVRIGWELQLGGERRAWERLEQSSLWDLAQAFAREAYIDFRTLNSGEAAASVFETWFLSERCRHEDKKLIKQMLADYKGYVFESEEAAQGVTPALIAALGAMPFGKNYLALHAAAIMADPVFTEVRDRSNANFLWFIKFEQSFRETERELQTSPSSGASPASASPARDAITSGNKGAPRLSFGPDHDISEFSRHNAEIIPLFCEGDGRRADPSGTAKRGSRGKTPTGGTRANVVYLRRKPLDSLSG